MYIIQDVMAAMPARRYEATWRVAQARPAALGATPVAMLSRARFRLQRMDRKRRL
jgi:hypothetical protein